MRSLWIIGLTTTLGLPTGCGTFKDKDDAKRRVKSAAELTGQWKTECLEKGFLTTEYQREEYKFSPTADFNKRVILHEDSNCKDETFALEVSGDYDSVGKAKDVENAKKINFNVSKVTAESYTDDMTDALNAEKYCGIDNWKTKKERDVTGKDCSGDSFEKGDVLYDIYRIEDKDLKFGQTLILLEGLGVKKRPTKLDNERVYSKS